MAEEWLIHVRDGFHNQNLDCNRKSDDVSIYNVPKFLIQQKQSAYVPQMVSLGPIHHDPALSEILAHKMHATRKMFATRYATNVELEQKVIGPILKLASRVRKCYQQQIQFDDNYLAWMLTLDACFILEILRAVNVNTNSDHSLFNRNTIEYTAYPIITDILMLENQIPLFVLLKILELELERNEERAFSEFCQLLDCARIARLFYPFLQKGIPRTQESKHLLDLIHMLVIDSSDHKDTVRTSNCPRKQEIIIPSASELSRAGIKFTEVKGKFKEIRIKKNRFYLPRIRISSSIETLLRNLMALEICEADDTCVISRYVLLMCELIDSERDVHVLKKAGIIKSYMASDREVTDFFNRLSKGITRSYEDPFAEVREDAHKHYHSKFKVMIAEFADDHCSRPWRTVSVVGACMFLLLAAVQTSGKLVSPLLKYL